MVDNTQTMEGYRPVEKAPTLVRFYGVGTALYGRRKVSAEDPSLSPRYYCFTLLYIPIMLLGKYLVRSADGAEYVVAKGLLPNWARVWNISLMVAVLAVVGIGGYQGHVNSPEYLAQQTLDNGLAAIEQGEISTGMEQVFDAYHTDTAVSGKALAHLKSMGQPASLQARPPADAAIIVKALTPVADELPELRATAESLFEDYRADDPLAGKHLADALIALTDDPETIEQYRQVQYQLMAQVVEAYPDNADYAVELALLEERYNSCERCEALLEPHKDQLGEGEGARILGQVYAGQGNVEAAYQLLAPYTDTRLAHYHQVSAEFDQVLDDLWNRMIDFLNSPSAPQGFIDRYDAAANEQEESALLNELFATRLDGSREYQAIQARYEAAATIVPVALDLGIVMLNRATAMTDPEEQQQQLAAAEETFLAVRDEAGDSDDYQLYLGQVYYWLGKEEEGQALFDNLLAKYGRAPDVLMSLSDILRDLGATGAARELAQEGYEKAANETEKQNFARQLALLAQDREEQLAWLEKSDLSNPFTKADLYSSKAMLASEAGNDEEALDLLNKAIEVYQGIPEDASVHNNIALVYMQKYRLAGNESDYNQALANLDQAVALQPDNSIILSNSIDYHKNKAYRDLVAEHLDLAAMEIQPDRRLLSYLYKSQKQKDEFLAELLSHPSMDKVLSYTNKALLLAPKDRDLFSRSYALYYYLRQVDKLKLLADRVAPLSFDLRGAEKEVADFRKGLVDEEAVDSVRRNIASLQATLAQLDTERHAREAAVLRSYILANQINLADFQEPANLDQMVAMAEANYSAMPTAATTSDYENVLWLRLVNDLRADNASFAAFYDEYHRYYDRTALVGMGINEIDGLTEAIAKHPDFQVLTQLTEENLSLFPRAVSLPEWYVYHRLGETDLANSLKQIAQREGIHGTLTDLSLKFSANYENGLFYKYLSHQIAGDKDAAEEILAQVNERGLHFPESFSL